MISVGLQGQRGLVTPFSSFSLSSSPFFIVAADSDGEGNDWSEFHVVTEEYIQARGRGFVSSSSSSQEFRPETAFRSSSHNESLECGRPADGHGLCRGLIGMKTDLLDRLC